MTDESEYQGGALLVVRDLSEQALLRGVCEAAGRELTRAEWLKGVGGESPTDLLADDDRESVAESVSRLVRVPRGCAFGETEPS